jgi:hypothetical protein
MAIQKDFLDEEEQGTQGINLEGTAVGSGGFGGPMGAKPQGTGWTNLQQYLTANEGQGAGVAQDITKGVQEKVDSADSNAKLWEQSAKARVDQSTKRDDQGFTNQINTDPTKIDKNAFNAWAQLQSYWGGANAQADSGYGDVYGQTQQAKQAVQGMQNYDTQKALAQQTYGKNGRYTQGMGTLDTFIMRGDKAGQQALQGFQDRNKNVGAGFDQAKANVDQYIAGAAGRGKAVTDNAYKAIGDRYSALTASGQAAAQAKLKAERDAAQQNVLRQYAEAGIANPNTGMLSNTVTTRDVGLADGLNDVDLAALNALADLDLDASTNALNRSADPLARINDELVRKNIEDYKYATRKGDTSQTTTDGVTFTPTSDVRYDANGNVITDSTDEYVNRILNGFAL